MHPLKDLFHAVLCCYHRCNKRLSANVAQLLRCSSVGHRYVGTFHADSAFPFCVLLLTFSIPFHSVLFCSIPCFINNPVILIITHHSLCTVCAKGYAISCIYVCNRVYILMKPYFKEKTAGAYFNYSPRAGRCIFPLMFDIQLLI